MSSAPSSWLPVGIRTQPSSGHLDPNQLRARRVGRAWVLLLLLSICMEGFARRFVPQVPAPVWYFLKDGLLIAGGFLFGTWRPASREARGLWGARIFLVAAALAWTVLQLLNPAQGSLVLAVVGLRSYWLWWLAPLIVPSALRYERDLSFVSYLLVGLSAIVAGMAVLQFASPSDALVNRYAWTAEGGAAGTATVEGTGRVRVSGTFSYLTGFTDYVVLVFPFLMAAGLDAARARQRTACFAAAGALAVVLPMSGARSTAILVVLAALAIFWASGALLSRRGWGSIVLIAAFIALPVVVSPEAVEGLLSRFAASDTTGRFDEALQYLPPYALLENSYPLWGLGTGAQHNLRFALGMRFEWISEGEMGRYLIELGAVGYVLMWCVRAGLAYAIYRAGRGLHARKRGSLAGLCYALAGLSLVGNLVFDHVWQAVLFSLLGILLQVIVTARSAPAVVRVG